MLVLTVFDGDALEFTFKQTGEVRRVRGYEQKKGHLMLHQHRPGSPFYHVVATLVPDALREVRPGVRLRYAPNDRGVWKVFFKLDESVAVERKPAKPKSGLRELVRGRQQRRPSPSRQEIVHRV